ncbi:MAG TPA: excinuclease ABC subunit UvrC [Trueperaceae bacterium]|nr:excinuclease ABC subunit UvrC [Trueperaceae bacterium]
MKRTDLPVLPQQPGCYLFVDPDGRVIYVGKAKNLRSRVRSYFGKYAGHKSRLLTRDAAAVEFIVTADEVEALILEANLIKRHQPHFNVLLKDDKSYPFLKLTNERYPTLILTRRVVKDGGIYFGPYPSAGSVRRVMDLVYSVFKLRKNSGVPMQKRKRPCLRHHMGRCFAPCVNDVDDAQYQQVVAQVKAFLEGRVADVVEEMEEGMRAAAGRQDFELAATYRDRLDAVKRVTGYDTSVVHSEADDLDFLGLAKAGNYAMVQLFQMRGGRVVGRDKRFLQNAEGATDVEILEAFMADYYGRAMQVPPLVLVPKSDLDTDVWSRYLTGRAGKRVELRTPRRGDKVELVEMAERNAATGVEAEIALLERRGEAPGVSELQNLLELENAPWRIEGFDISNLMGEHTVASVVVFEGGRAKRSDYRRLRIRDPQRSDDYFSMNQAVRRRFTGTLADSMPLPDLLLIDGGKGQMSAAKRALQEAGLDIPLVGLAKKQETLVMESGEEMLVPVSHPALKLLINVRDEAHRVAVGYNRQRRGKALTRSVLDDVPGIGPKRRDALLAHFSSVDELRSADVGTLAAVPGVGQAAAKAVKDYFAGSQR